MKRLRLSLKQYLALTAVVALVAWCVANYESWYGVRWTPADATRLAADLKQLDGEITEELAVRIAIDEAASRKGNRLLPTGVHRDTWARHLGNGDFQDAECFIIHLEDIPEGINGAFTRIVGGHCTVCVGLNGTVVDFVGGR